MDRAEAVGALRVQVAYSPSAGVAEEVSVDLPSGATLLDALHASGVLKRYPHIDLARQSVGVWGRMRPLDALLRAGDRVEIYRPLQIDPMEARRRRQRQQQRATCNPPR